MTEELFSLIPYSPALNDAIAFLYKECGSKAGDEFPYNSIRISLSFPLGYDKLLRLYDSFKSYLMWDTSLEKPIALITGFIKSMYLHGKLRKAGIITDLKQLEDYEEYKPARQLFTHLEQEFRTAGVEYILIYYPNNIIKILGEAQLSDYDTASIRMIKYLYTDTSAPTASLTKLPADLALSTTLEHYRSIDFLPDDLNRIFTSEYYLGTYQLTNENGTMGVSAWSPTDYCISTFSQVYWPIRNKDQAYSIFLRILVIYILSTGIYLAAGMWIYEAISEQMLKLCFFVIALYLFVKLSVILWGILEHLRICYLDKSRKVTLFGFYSTATDFDYSLFSALISSLRSNLGEQGYSLLQLNFDSEHEGVLSELMEFSRENSVLHRPLTGLSTYRTVVSSFLDPREVL